MTTEELRPDSEESIDEFLIWYGRVFILEEVRLHDANPMRLEKDSKTIVDAVFAYRSWRGRPAPIAAGFVPVRSPYCPTCGAEWAHRQYSDSCLECRDTKASQGRRPLPPVELPCFVCNERPRWCAICFECEQTLQGVRRAPKPSPLSLMAFRYLSVMAPQLMVVLIAGGFVVGFFVCKLLGRFGL